MAQNPWLVDTVKDKYQQRQAMPENGMNDAAALRAMADQFGEMEAQTDLSPIAALVDSWTGSKLAQSYKPFTAKDKVEKMAALRKLAGDTENAAMKTDTGQLALLAKMAGQDRSAQQDNQAGTELQRLTTKLDGEVTPIVRDLQMLDNVYEEGDFSKITATLSNFAKGVGREAGVLTNQDLERVLPPSIGGSWEKLTSYFKNTRPQDISPEVVQGIKELVAQAKEGAYSVYKKRYEGLSKQFKSRPDRAGYMARGGENVILTSLDTLQTLRTHTKDRPDDVPIWIWGGLEGDEKDILLSKEPKERKALVEQLKTAKKKAKK